MDGWRADKFPPRVLLMPTHTFAVLVLVMFAGGSIKWHGKGLHIATFATSSGSHALREFRIRDLCAFVAQVSSVLNSAGFPKQARDIPG